MCGEEQERAVGPFRPRGPGLITPCFPSQRSERTTHQQRSPGRAAEETSQHRCLRTARRWHAPPCLLLGCVSLVCRPSLVITSRDKNTRIRGRHLFHRHKPAALPAYETGLLPGAKECACCAKMCSLPPGICTQSLSRGRTTVDALSYEGTASAVRVRRNGPARCCCRRVRVRRTR